MTIQRRKRKDGSTAYGVLVYDPAVKRKRPVGTFNSEAEARRVERTWSWERPRGTATVSQAATEWLALQTAIRPRTLKSYTTHVNVICDYFGDARCDELTVRHLDEYSAYLSDRYADTTARLARLIFRAVLKQANRYGYCSLSPDELKGPNRAVELSREIKPLTPSEHEDLIAALPEFYRPLFAVWPHIGLRTSEMFGLTWEHVTDDAVLVRQQFLDGKLSKLKTKSGRRDVPLSAEASAWLDVARAQAVWNPDGFVFTTEQGTPLRAYLKADVLSPALVRAGLRDCRFGEVGRHAFATWMLSAGNNPKAVAELMGHANDPSVLLKTYAHLLPGATADAVNLMEAWRGKQIG